MNFQFLGAAWSKWAKSLICFCKGTCETSAGSTFKTHRFFSYWLMQEQRLKSSSKLSKISIVSPASFSGFFFFKSDPWYIKKVQKTASTLVFFWFFFPLSWGKYNLLPSLFCSAEMQIEDLQFSQNEAKINSWRTQKQTTFSKNTRKNFESNFPIYI